MHGAGAQWASWDVPRIPDLTMQGAGAFSNTLLLSDGHCQKPRISLVQSAHHADLLLSQPLAIVSASPLSFFLVLLVDGHLVFLPGCLFCSQHIWMHCFPISLRKPILVLTDCQAHSINDLLHGHIRGTLELHKDVGPMAVPDRCPCRALQ